MFSLTKRSGQTVSKRCIRMASTNLGLVGDQHNGSLKDEAKSHMEVPRIETNPRTNMLKAIFTGPGKYKSDYLRHLYFEEIHRKYGPIVRNGEIGVDSTFVHLFDPKDVETLFRNEDHAPIKKVFEPMHHARIMTWKYFSSKSFIFANGDVWYNLRKKAKAETLKVLNVDRYCPSFDQAAQEFVNNINTITDSNGIVESLLDEVTKWSIESLCWYLFGRRFGMMEINTISTKSEAQTVASCIHIIMEMNYKLELGFPWYKWIPTPSFWKLVRANWKLAKMTLQNINSMLNHIKNTTTFTERNPSFMIYMLTRDDVDEHDIIASVTDLMFGGIDTTSSLTSILIYHLSKHSAIQDEAYSEIMKVTPNPNAPITSSEINQLHYLRACMKETHRLSPVVDATARILKKDHVFSGYRIPAGTQVVVHHRLMGKTFFDEPHAFKPERWLKNENDNPVTIPFAWLPFGHGNRMCPGRRITQLETMMLLTRLLQKYQVSNMGDENIEMASRTANVPNKPLRIKFDRRG